MHGPFWVIFTDGTKACVEAEGSDAAKLKAEKVSGKTVARWYGLPYAASPVIGDRIPYRFGEKDVIQPTFCYKPDQCAGKGSCPQSWSCTE